MITAISRDDAYQAAEKLALLVWDILGNDPDAADRETLRGAAAACLKDTWKSPRPALIDAAREMAFTVLEWCDSSANEAYRKLSRSSRLYEELRLTK